MEVLSKTTSESPVLLSNFEVMNLLSGRITTREEKQKKDAEESNKRGKKHRTSTKFQHRDWIEEHVFGYLQTTPCVALESTSQMKQLKAKLVSTKRQKKAKSTGLSSTKSTTNKNANDSDKISSITTGFGLTEAEAIQVLNFMPTELVEIHLMIEELNSRLDENRQEELLQLIQSYSKNPIQPKVEDEEQQAEEDANAQDNAAETK